PIRRRTPIPHLKRAILPETITLADADADAEGWWRWRGFDGGGRARRGGGELLIDEDYKIWKKNPPFLYGFGATHMLDLPCPHRAVVPRLRRAAREGSILAEDGRARLRRRAQRPDASAGTAAPQRRLG
ncbi:unnamed protein product, partial [Urochloa humidicola]